jgi:hypothetical protein
MTTATTATRKAQAPPALVALLDLVQALHEPVGALGQQAAAAYRLLLESLEALWRLLDQAPDGISARQLLVLILKAVPVKTYQQESWHDLVQAVKDYGSDLLDRSCSTAADQVARALWRLRENEYQREVVDHPARKAKRARDTRERFRKAEGLEDPFFPRTGVFRWKGKEHRLGLRQWRLLKALWGGRAVDASAVMLAVYEHDALANNKLWGLQHALNDALRAQKLFPPFAVWRPSPLQLRLKKPPALR